jgi:hypothetical protein
MDGSRITRRIAIDVRGAWPVPYQHYNGPFESVYATLTILADGWSNRLNSDRLYAGRQALLGKIEIGKSKNSFWGTEAELAGVSMAFCPHVLAHCNGTLNQNQQTDMTVQVSLLI